MMALAKCPNKLQDKAMKNGWDIKREIWKMINDTKLDNFPEKTGDELRDLTMGIYQLKQAKSYTDEHFDENGSYEIMAHKKEDSVLKAQIRCRHTSTKTYNLWVECTQGLNPVTGWYCGCRSGARTVGCCAHVASVLLYLGYYRNETENSAAKPSKVHIDYVEDAAVDTWSTSSDLEEDE